MITHPLTEAAQDVPLCAAWPTSEAYKTEQARRLYEHACKLEDQNAELLASLQEILDGNTMKARDKWNHAEVIQNHYRIVRAAIAKATQS